MTDETKDTAEAVFRDAMKKVRRLFELPTCESCRGEGCPDCQYCGIVSGSATEDVLALEGERVYLQWIGEAAEREIRKRLSQGEVGA